MSVYVQVSGGRIVWRSVERVFPGPVQAREYLAEFKLPATVIGKSFEHRDLRFVLSHPIEDIRREDELPDNDVSSGAAERLQAAALKTSFRSEGTRDVKASDLVPPRSSKPANGDAIPLKTLCAELNIEPRVARQKLRKAMSREDGRWEFTPAEAEKVRAILKGA